MKVIFQQDVRGQGKKGEMKEVSEGYGRNYLLPRGLAVEANKDNLNTLALKEKARKAQEARERAEADVRRRDEQAKAGCAAVNEEFARREAEAAEAADRDYLRCKRALDAAFEEHRKAWLAEITGALRKGE